MYDSPFATANSDFKYEPGEITVREVDPKYCYNDSLVLPPSQYIIGDPCYSAGLDDDAWPKWVDIALKEEPIEVAMYGDYPVTSVKTAHGDGSYLGSDGKYYPVDSGAIGAVPVELMERMGISKDEYDHVTQVIEVPNNKTLTITEDDGAIVFSIEDQDDLVIDTDPDFEDCDDEKFYEDDEDYSW